MFNFDIPLTDLLVISPWIVAFITVIGAFVTPVVTIKMTNRHALKLLDMNNKQKDREFYVNAKITSINNFISYTSQYLANATQENASSMGQHYFKVYPYVSPELYEDLDALYLQLIDYKGNPRQNFCLASRPIIQILKDQLEEYEIQSKS